MIRRSTIIGSGLVLGLCLVDGLHGRDAGRIQAAPPPSVTVSYPSSGM